MLNIKSNNVLLLKTDSLNVVTYTVKSHTMARQLSIALWNAQLDNLRNEWELLQNNLQHALDKLEVAEIDLSNARERLRNVSSGDRAVILLNLGFLQETVEDAYEDKRLAKRAVKKWKTIVSGLEKKTEETKLKIDDARASLLLEMELDQIGQ